MSRRVIYRVSCAGVLAFSAAILGGQRKSLAAGLYDYHPVGGFTLPTDPYGNSVLFNALSTGQLVTINESQISVETAVGSGNFTPTGTLPAGFAPSFGPTFLTVAPNGMQAAAGDGNGDIAVFNPLAPATATVFSLGTPYDFDAKWFSSNQLAITDPNGVDILNTSNGKVTTVISDVNGASGGIAFDSAGNLYTGDGYYFGGGASQTGLIKEFSAANWQAALTPGGAPLDFEASGNSVAQLLSADSLGFDASGNFYVGGADSEGSTSDYGYDALVSASAIQAAVASPQSSPTITGSSPSSVLREFDDPYDPINDPGYWDYNSAIGDLYLSYFGESDVQILSAVPEPGSITLLVLVGGGLLLRRRKRSRCTLVAAVAICGCLAAASQTAHADINPNDAYNASYFAASVVSSTVPSSGSAYSNPSALLGQPALTFNNSSNPNVQQSEMAKIVEPPINYDLYGNPVLTELPNYPATTEVTVQMGAPITHDPSHPYGDDLIVFGNSFYLANGQPSDSTNLNALTLTGGIYGHPVQVSVSPDDVHWFSFPVTSVLQPYSAFQWDDANADWTDNQLNPTIPLNPAIYTTNFAGASAASVLDAYGDSAGGTAFDLEDALDSSGNTLFQDGYSSIDYVEVASTSSGYSVISGIAAVSDGESTATDTWIPEPRNMTAVAVGGLSLLRRFRA